MAFNTNIEIMAYGTYMYENNSLPLDNYSVVARIQYAKILPPIIKINAADKEKLKLFLSEVY